MVFRVNEILPEKWRSCCVLGLVWGTWVCIIPEATVLAQEGSQIAFDVSFPSTANVYLSLNIRWIFFFPFFRRCSIITRFCSRRSDPLPPGHPWSIFCGCWVIVESDSHMAPSGCSKQSLSGCYGTLTPESCKVTLLTPLSPDGGITVGLVYPVMKHLHPPGSQNRLATALPESGASYWCAWLRRLSRHTARDYGDFSSTPNACFP